MFDKLKFWKQKDEFEDFPLGDDPGLPHLDEQQDLGGHLGLPQQPSFPNDLSSSPSLTPPQRRQPYPAASQPSYSSPPAQFSSPYPQQAYAPPQTYAQQAPPYQAPPSYSSRDIDVVVAKLDGIRMQIEALSQRLANLEQSSSPQNPQKRQFW